jgi:hypothetical protein
MVLFILFPGLGCTEKDWELDIEKKGTKYYLKKLDFLKNLKKLGQVYTYTPKIYNIYKYYVEENQSEGYRKLYTDIFLKTPSKVILDDINIDKECKRIYKKLKNKNEKFIPIGHSIGCWFALHFSNLYPSKCLKTIFLDGSLIAPIVHDHHEKQSKKVKSSEITTKNLEYLFNTVVKNLKKNIHIENKKVNKYIYKILDITVAYYYRIMKKELNGKLKVPLISFRTLYFESETEKLQIRNTIGVKNEEELYKLNGKKVITYYLVNATHLPWRIQRYSDQIINEIKRLV